MFTGDSQLRSRNGTNATGSSSIRPRAVRLISGLDEDDDVENNLESQRRPVSLFESTSTASPPRGFSPLPSRHPSKTNPSDRGRSCTSNPRGQRSTSSGVFAGILGSSWTTVQGITSSLWGAGSDSAPASPNRQLKSRSGPPTRPTSGGDDAAKWGSTAYKTVSGIGAGSVQERESMVREIKRREMLAAGASSTANKLGKHKRRQSDDVSRVYVQTDDNEDALVYVHHVRPTDTVAGLSIRYGCPQAIIRKMNRLWSNDSVQTRKTITLPVTACSVKGTPVSSTSYGDPAQDLLGDDDIMMHESPVSSSPQLVNPDHFDDISSQTPSVSASTVEPREEHPWTHESWVTFPNSEEKIEVGRLPRGQLGFFPRARRKSNGTMSGFATPKASLDIARSVASSSKGSPAIRPQASRARSLSRPHRAQNFASFMQGPGGIGTLEKTARLPGPAMDPLNEIIAPHLPDVRPPPSQMALATWIPGYLDRNDDLISFGPSSAYATAMAQETQPGMDLQEISNAIETWIRKTAKKATGAFDNASSNLPNTTNLSGGATGEAGDLIEMIDSIDLNTPSGHPSITVNGQAQVQHRSEGFRGRRIRNTDNDRNKLDKGD